MNYRFFIIFFFIFLNSCSVNPINKIDENNFNREYFTNKGFTLIYSPELKINKLVNKKIDERELTIFQKNLKKNTQVKIINLINNRTILARVGDSANYPNFYNSVISKRIATELDLSLDEPYIQIIELFRNSSFIAKTAKTFDEEKNVATKAPVDEIKIISLSDANKPKNKNKNNKIKKNFNYIIKIADLYFRDSAESLSDRIQEESQIKVVAIRKLSKSKYRVFLGPFTNINLLQKAFNDIKILEFENIEIIYND